MRKIIYISGALISWFGVALQFYLILIHGAYSTWMNVVNFFSFFTILSNILAALHYTVAASDQDLISKKFLTRPMTIAAIATYITMVGITYNLILRSLWNPQGWQKAADETLHLITPALFVLYWIFVADKKGLNWKGIFSWMLFPLLYSFYTLLRGAAANYYPYPFMDVSKLGYPAVLLNCLYITIAFFAVASLFIATGKMLVKGNPGTN